MSLAIPTLGAAKGILFHLSIEINCTRLEEPIILNFPRDQKHRTPPKQTSCMTSLRKRFELPIQTSQIWVIHLNP